MGTDIYVVWSNEHGAWWKPARRGYTDDLLEAGHYSRTEALDICRQAIMSAPHIKMIAELPARLADVEEFLSGQFVPDVIRGKP